MNTSYPTGQRIAELCVEKFQTLPKTGKPTAKEWTVLAGIVQHEANTKVNKVVALGAGTKCIGQSKLCTNGLILHDAHAEILARRALLRYFYNELKKAAIHNEQNTSIFAWNAEKLKFIIKPELSYHFMCTQVPCGDACIVAEEISNDDIVPANKKRKLEQHELTENNFGNLLTNNVATVFTGAKLIGNYQDAMQQILGAVRTKPGRGDRTLSMSCSDKLSKWNVMGIQGALLDKLLASPIYIKSLTFCCNANNEVSIRRAIYARWQNRVFINSKYKPQKPIINFFENIKFTYTQHADKQPAPNGLVWCDVQDKHSYEISVNGKRQGVTAKKSHTAAAALQVSRHHLLQAYVALLRTKPELCANFNLNINELLHLKYSAFKQLAVSYQSAWKQVKNEYFQQWTHKPAELQSFTLAELQTEQIN